MANTRTSAKRARQADRRNARNQVVRSATRSAVRGAMDAITAKDAKVSKEAFQAAIRALMKAASKGAIPKGRASRKIGRLTRLAQRTVPTIFSPKK
jgi:small subunit ribosomal protein S20